MSRKNGRMGLRAMQGRRQRRQGGPATRSLEQLVLARLGSPTKERGRQLEAMGSLGAS